MHLQLSYSPIFPTTWRAERARITLFPIYRMGMEAKEEVKGLSMVTDMKQVEA